MATQEPGSIDPAVIDGPELTSLLERSAAVLRSADGGHPDSAQLASLAALLSNLASRLRTEPPSRDQRLRLAEALGAGDEEEALLAAREITAGERARTTRTDWATLSTP